MMLVRNQEAREQTALGRFEIMAELYNTCSDEIKETILSFFETEEEKETFLMGAGFYKLFTNETYYKAARKVACEMFLESIKA